MKPKTPTKKQLASAEKMLLAGSSRYVVARDSGVSKHRVEQLWRQLGDRIPARQTSAERVPDEVIIGQLLSGKTVKNIARDLHTSDNRISELRKTISEQQISYRDRTREQLNRSENFKAKKTITLYEIIAEDLLAAIRALPPPSALPPERLVMHKKQESEEMILKLSDIQIGQLVDARESGGLGGYSVEIFLERLEFLKASLKKIFEIHLPNTPYPVFNVFFLGDIIEGSTIFKGQQRQTDIHSVEQVLLAVRELSSLIAWIASLYPWRVKCYCVIGNHGRIGDKGEQSPLNNLDFLVYKFMEKWLEKYKNIEFHVSESWYMIVEKLGRRHLLVHGDDIKSWMSIPFYGLERSDSRFRAMFKDFDAMHDYIHTAHHHQSASIRGNQFMNGTWVGGSELSIKTMQVVSLPTQTLQSIHHKFGVTWTRDIQLCDPAQNKGRIKIYD